MSNSTSSDPVPSDGVAEFVSVLTPALITAVVFIGLFVALRDRVRNVYAPRSAWLARKYTTPELPPGPVAWIRAVYDISEEYMMEHVGMDAVVVVRVFWLGVQTCAMCLVVGIAVMVVNAEAGTEGKTGFDKLSLANIEDESQLMWVHVAGMWIVSLVVYYLLKKNYNELLALTQEYKATRMENRTVLVRNLPAELQDDEALRAFFAELYPDDYYGALLIRDVAELRKQVEEYAARSAELEHATAVWEAEQAKPEAERKRPVAKEGKVPCTATKHDALEWLPTRLAELRGEIQAARDGERTPSTAGFVVFKTLTGAATAAQVKHALEPGTTEADLAPEPREVFWPGAAMSPLLRSAGGNITTLMYIGMIWAYVLAVIAIASFNNLEELSKNGAFSWLSFVQDLPPAVRGLIQGLLPVILLAVLMALAPVFFRMFAERSGAPSESAIQSSVLGRYYVFQVVFTFFFTLLAGALISKASEVAGDPGSIASLLGEAVPSKGNFFLNYVVLQALSVFPGQLARIGPLIVSRIMLRFVAKTHNERMAVLEPGAPDISALLPPVLVIFLIVIAYSVLQPVMLLFGLVYFLIGYVTFKYQLVFVLTPVYESGGSFWHRIFKFTCVALAVSQVTLVGVVALKKGVAMGPFLLPLPVLTFLFYRHFAGLYAEAVSSKKLAREVARRVDAKAGGADEEAMADLLAGYQQPSLTADLDDIVYQLSARAKSAVCLSKLPPKEVWELGADAGTVSQSAKSPDGQFRRLEDGGGVQRVEVVPAAQED